MASAEELRQFATIRFFQDGLGKTSDKRLWDVYRNVLDDGFPEIIEFAMHSVGTLAERYGWQSLGAHLGYMHGPEPLGDDDRLIVRRVLDSPQIAVWPKWFRNFTTFLLEGDGLSRYWANIPDKEPETVAVFQAAMVIAEELRDPLISNLQASLQDSNSGLDNQVDGLDVNTLFAQFEEYPDEKPKVQSLAQSVAGFFKLIEVMAAFDNLFADLGRMRLKNEEGTDRLIEVFEVYPESVNRFAVARATANLGTWRLNLREPRTVARLGVVVSAFWDVCETQLWGHLERGVSWSSAGSYDALIAMLERWRDRADPEPDAQRISLQQLKRSARQVREQEAQSEG